MTAQRPHWLAGRAWRVLHMGETDCVAGHIGFELRCAERKFIPLTSRAVSDSGDMAHTLAVSAENNLLCRTGPFPDRRGPLADIASGAPSGRPAAHRSSNLLTPAGRIRPSMRRKKIQQLQAAPRCNAW